MILVLTAIAAILQINGLSFKKINYRAWGIFTATILIFILSLTKEISDNKSEKYGKDFGVLDGTLTSKATIYPTLGVGSNTFILENFGYVGEVFDSIDLYLNVKKGVLYLGTTVRSEDGEAIGKIVDNEWQTNPLNMFDKNFDGKSLEIKDNNDHVVFQAIFDGEKVNIAGCFYKNDSTGVAIYPNSENVFEMRFLRKGDKFDHYIKPIFKYPSKLHPGEKVD